jgi:hypothetical protein
MIRLKTKEELGRNSQDFTEQNRCASRYSPLALDDLRHRHRFAAHPLRQIANREPERQEKLIAQNVPWSIRRRANLNVFFWFHGL